MVFLDGILHSLQWESEWALTGVAQLAGRRPAKRKVASLIPGRGTCQGCGLNAQWGRVQEAASQCFSLTSMFLMSLIHI